jgi:2-polyprenyl-3-methyl-5-hydroxy-6-metoxy-1,4-benzoquinol methylase
MEHLPPCPVGGDSHRVRFAFTRYGHHLYRCMSCGHLWVYPIPSAQELADFYSKGYFHGEVEKRGYQDYERDKKSVLPEFAYFLERLEKATDRRDLLDIGAATGVFMECAIQRGWKARGLELSEYAAEVGRAKGLDITCTALEDVSEDTYRGSSVVTMWDVVEHFRDPMQAFAVLSRIISQNGLIMFATPQSDSFFARVMGKMWTLLAPPQHLHYFSRKSMQDLLEKNGFEVVSIEWRGKSFDAGYIIHFVMGWLRIKSSWLDRLAHWHIMQRIVFRINPRDMMIVLAKKR